MRSFPPLLRAARVTDALLDTGMIWGRQIRMARCVSARPAPVAHERNSLTPALSVAGRLLDAPAVVGSPSPALLDRSIARRRETCNDSIYATVLNRRRVWCAHKGKEQSDVQREDEERSTTRARARLARTAGSPFSPSARPTTTLGSPLPPLSPCSRPPPVPLRRCRSRPPRRPHQRPSPLHLPSRRPERPSGSCSA